MTENLVCPFWGPVFEDRLVHPDCSVVVYKLVTDKRGGTSHIQEGPPTAVCKCECQTCKRAWEAESRPRIVDGKLEKYGRPA